MLQFVKRCGVIIPGSVDEIGKDLVLRLSRYCERVGFNKDTSQT